MFFRFNDFLNLFYPEVCSACNTGLFRGERVVCTRCLVQLPQTNFHLWPDNPVEKQFWGKVPVDAATALFYFSKGRRVQQLIHRLKYHGEKEVGQFTGRMLALKILNQSRFQPIDAIAPIPLHASKLRVRGFNQAEEFSKGLAEVLQVPSIGNLLIRNRATSTQTRKHRYARFENVDRVFSVNHGSAKNLRGILLADDVITTGSTLAAAVAAIHEYNPSLRVYVCAIAFASLL